MVISASNNPFLLRALLSHVKRDLSSEPVYMWYADEGLMIQMDEGKGMTKWECGHM